MIFSLKSVLHLSYLTPGAAPECRRQQTECLEMPFLKTDISWQLGVIGSICSAIAETYLFLFD